MCLQQTLRHLDNAYRRFFKKVGNYPKFKKKTNSQSITLMSNAFKYLNGKIWVIKNKVPLDIRWSHRFDGTPRSITILKDCADRYFISILVETDIKPLKKIKKEVGLDLGLTDVVVLSNGKKVKAPKITKKFEKKLAHAQRLLARKQIGSNNRNKARLKVAKMYNKISDSRTDFNHKLTTDIIRKNQVICIESLGINKLLESKKFAKEISDVSWGEITRQLTYKAAWYGRTLIKVGKFFPSTKKCSHCGYILPEIKLNVRKWRCPQCSKMHDRDINAAKNILAEGHSVIACGENISPLTVRKDSKKAIFCEAGI